MRNELVRSAWKSAALYDESYRRILVTVGVRRQRLGVAI
jgi:hypothetical protein